MSRSETPAVAAVEAFLLDFQDRVCRALEEEDGGSRFREEVFSGEAGALARPVRRGVCVAHRSSAKPQRADPPRELAMFVAQEAAGHVVFEEQSAASADASP